MIDVPLEIKIVGKRLLVLDEKGIAVFIEYLIIDEVEGGLPLGLSGEGITILHPFLKSSLSQIIKIESSIHVFCKGPVKSVLQFRTILLGETSSWDKESGLPFFSHREGAPRQIENRNIFQMEDGPLGHSPSS